MNAPEQWEALGRRLRFHLGRQPEMTSTQGPQRWAQILFMWGLESMYLAYGRRYAAPAMQDALDDFLDAKRAGGG